MTIQSGVDQDDDLVGTPLLERVRQLELAVLLLARHVGAVGWNYELQHQLDLVRDEVRRTG
jgi:hypothetical protein